MSKDVSGSGLLSKVARFVLHPTVNWSDLDAPLQGMGTDQDRQALKAAIERKRRNDAVRQREFNMLRTVLQQGQSGRAQTGGASSGFSHSLSGAAAGASYKEKTIEKIAQIEAQMATHWVGKRPSAPGAAGQKVHIGGVVVPPAPHGEVTEPGHLHATQIMSWPTTIRLESVTPSPSEASVRVPSWAESVPAATSLVYTSDPVVEEAAVRFANGETTAVAQALQGVLTQEAGRAAGLVAWHALLDYWLTQSNPQAYEAIASQYAPVFGVPAPEWPDRADAERLPLGSVCPVWTCPVVLDRAAVQTLATMLSGQDPVKWLDWSALVSADAAAAQALLDLLVDWMAQPVDFRFVGGQVLRRRLKSSTPSGRRENDPVWWRLRLTVLQLMRRVDEFDLAALDFCVTYGEVPPDWVEPVSRFELAEVLPLGAVEPLEPPPQDVPEPIKPLVTQLAGLDVMEWPAAPAEAPQRESDGLTLSPQEVGGGQPFALPCLRGVLAGDIPRAIDALQRALVLHPKGQPFLIDCSGLERVDFPAAGSLLQWLLGAVGQGARPELVGVGRLVAVFLHVVGLDEAAPIRLREY